MTDRSNLFDPKSVSNNNGCIGRRRVVCPIIDIIHDETFAYTRSFELHWGAFNWQLHFRWFPIGQSEFARSQKSKTDATDAFKTPVMAGGLFAIDRDYFYEMGSYDSHMNIWGGENIEMSLRIWQCGGRVEISPCSHVAHLFRKSSPYDFGGQNVADVLYLQSGPSGRGLARPIQELLL